MSIQLPVTLYLSSCNNPEFTWPFGHHLSGLKVILGVSNTLANSDSSNPPVNQTYRAQFDIRRQTEAYRGAVCFL